MFGVVLLFVLDVDRWWCRVVLSGLYCRVGVFVWGVGRVGFVLIVLIFS